MSDATTAISIPQLQADVTGSVVAPGDPGYDKGRTVFYGGIDRRPAVIVRAAGADDVSRVIAAARETGLELAIRSGAHSIPVTAPPRAGSFSTSATWTGWRSTSKAVSRGPAAD